MCMYIHVVSYRGNLESKTLATPAWFRRNGIKHFHIQGDGLEKRPFFVTVRKKRLIKVRQFKVNEKRN